jgi:hypothetical protein
LLAFVPTAAALVPLAGLAPATALPAISAAAHTAADPATAPHRARIISSKPSPK